MNINDFMSSSDEEESTEEMVATDSADTEIGVIVVPKNIDFNMNVDMTEVLFQNIVLRNLNGKLVVKDGTADMKNLSMNTMEGAVVMNGSYSTAKDETSPELKALFALNELSFAQTYKELDMVRQMAPIFENLSGNFSGKMTVDTELDNTMSPKLETLTANGSLNTRNLNLSGVDIIDKIADATGRKELKNLSAKDLNVGFTIADGRVHTKPFDIKMGDMNLNLSGSTGLDQTIDYVGKLKLPATGELPISTIGLKIGGKFTAPKITIDTQSIVRQATESAVEKATEKAVEAVGKQLGVDLSDANKQKEELVKVAEQAAQKLVAEAEKQKANLVSKAGSNVIKKLAAEKAGDVLIAEAKEQGAKLIAEAEKKGDELIRKASEQ
jgi:vacuolar-type H+-ATPase subunit H